MTLDYPRLAGLIAVGAVTGIVDALVAADAVQCGFCTPGIVVTAAALLEGDEGTVESALAGNLCRCTGYLPIIAAVRAAASNHAPDRI